MTYTSFSFMCFLTILGICYFVLPKKLRMVPLALFSAVFIYLAGGLASASFVYGTALVTYGVARGIEKSEKAKKLLLTMGVLFVLGLLVFLKYRSYYLPLAARVSAAFAESKLFSIAVPIGISFYSLQIIAYLVDVYRGQISAEKNILKYILYVTYFPHILQGPIARYGTLSKTLFEGADFDYDRVCKGLQLLLWGVAQKLIIADRAALVVNEVFMNNGKYGSTEVIYAAILYGIELYADFSGCVNISIGVSEVFGIALDHNFMQPYFATSVQDFWRRWHITLSQFLRDYVYIPLGGNRKGTIRKYANLMITFFVSGIWHGVGNHFIVWGVLHGFYQVCGNLTKKVRERIREGLHISKDNKVLHVFSVLITFMFVDIAWVFFRADSISVAVKMLKTAAIKWNPWVLFNEQLFTLGVDRKETYLLWLFIVLLFVFDYLHEKKIKIRDTIASYSIVARWSIYFVLLFSIILFGKYGYGFDAVSFIYMQF